MGFLIPLSMPLLLLMNTYALNNPTYDPCTTYTALDQPWRANNETGLNICDRDFDWSGWYRLFYYGMNIRMPESCVPTSRCGTYHTLWLNGSHPQIEDGVVTRQACGNGGSDCCSYRSTSIRVKACPGNYYVYEFSRPIYWNIAYCTDISTITRINDTTAAATGAEFNGTITNTSGNSTFDPCLNYTVLDDYWRATSSNYLGHDDTLVKWNGWYRLYLQGTSAQISEWCVNQISCGGYTPLWLNGSHPLLQDGIVTREIYGSYGSQCSYYRSNSIKVKACPGQYYVYGLVKPNVSIPMPSYCTATFNAPTYDPCTNYTALDQPWRANNGTGLGICDYYFNWNGWYRLFYNGMNIRMAESCVPTYRCGTYYPLWLNGPHPQIEDGVVIRQVCGNEGSDCCSFRPPPIQVKACPGNYYVYKLVHPAKYVYYYNYNYNYYYCSVAYCTDVRTVTPTAALTTAVTSAQFNITRTNTPDNSTFDPCLNYTVLDDYWRTTSSNYLGHDDTLIEWSGWYRLYLQGKSAQLTEWCVSRATCGGFTQLLLRGSHPLLQDGILTREIYGTPGTQCSYYRSKPIQVKACPGNYYVYKLIKPDVSIPMPSYCTVAFTTLTYDPCNNYTSLDQPWRANNETGLDVCDSDFNWNGWYRLFYNGMDIRLSESCVPNSRCGAYYTLWLNGPHPQIRDGVVTREVCANGGNDCCSLRPTPIQVKACPGNYYVYELIYPGSYTYYAHAAFCTANTPASYTFDPCSNYTILDDYRRATDNYYHGHDDTLIKWNGWYRLYLQGKSAQLPEWCVSYMSCGGYTPLLLGGSHPRLQDGIVTREIYGARGTQCSYYRSKAIQVKACAGNYYVYKLVKPDISIPLPSYCTAITLSSPSVDPCYNYNVLDNTWRHVNNTDVSWSGQWWCDSNINWNGWYRLLYQAKNARMPESCVSQSRCGARVSLWLSDSHPRLEDGVVTRRVCGSWNNDCCYFKSFPIQVKACPGNYYVYEFVRPIVCSSAYCAENTTNTPVQDITTRTPDIKTTSSAIKTTNIKTTSPVVVTMKDQCKDLNCTADEWCGERDGIYGCFCNENRTRMVHKPYDSRENCESSSGTMSLSRCQLFEAGFPANVLHLSDPSCNGTLQNGRLEFHFDNDDHICGTNLTGNGTHFIYENSIQGVADSAGGLINRKKHLDLRFSCVYQLSQTLTMDTEFNSLQSIVHKTLPDGQGLYQVRMKSYQDAAFSHPYNGKVDIEVDQRIYVEVIVQGVDSRQIATVIDSCWTTPVNDQNYAVRWNLIVNKCPNPDDNTVEVLQNGVFTTSQFSFKMFDFNGNYSKVFLHCAVHLCLLQNNNCAAKCSPEPHHRAGRSMELHDSTSISMGPFIWTSR